MSDSDDLIARKKALRARAKEARALAQAASGDAPSRAAEAFLEAVELSPGAIVSGYRPIGDELDPTPLMTALIARGARLCVPVIEGAEAPLSFRAWSEASEMIPGAFGAPIPKAGAELTPDIVVLPLLAFDRAGGRLGYGGGHFDRTLAALRAAGEARAIGFAFAAQEMETLPQEPTDQRLDAVVTEEGAIFFPL